MPFSIHLQSTQRDPMLYISLCSSSIHCKVNKMNVSPGKIYSSSIYNPGAFTAITSPGKVYTFLFFSSLTFSSFSGISGLVTDSNVNQWKPFFQKETPTHAHSILLCMYIQTDWCLPLVSLSSFFFLIFSFSARLMTHLSML